MLSFEDDTPMAVPDLGLQMIHSTPSGRTSPAEEPAKKTSIAGAKKSSSHQPEKWCIPRTG